MKKQHRHKTQGSVYLTCTVEAVQKLLNEPTNYAESMRLMSEAIAEFNPNKVKWAIEDETEREEWQDLLVQCAVVEYFK